MVEKQNGGCCMFTRCSSGISFSISMDRTHQRNSFLYIKTEEKWAKMLTRPDQDSNPWSLACQAKHTRGMPQLCATHSCSILRSLNVFGWLHHQKLTNLNRSYGSVRIVERKNGSWSISGCPNLGENICIFNMGRGKIIIIHSNPLVVIV